MLASPRTFCALVLLAGLLIPSPSRHTRRNTELDILQVKAARCEYRGITASFEEMTRAYALAIYDQPQVVRWEAQPSPSNPDHEVLVTCVFTAAGLKADTSASPTQVSVIRRRALPAFGVTWRLNDLAAIRIAPDNDYAQDAVATYQQTVDAFIAQMVVVPAAVSLRAGPGAEYPLVAAAEAGAVLLCERRERGWCHVRIPSTTTVGWIADDHVLALGHAP